MKQTILLITGRDILALIILFALFMCKLKGLNGMIDAMIALVIGYYFSKRVYEETERGKKK